MKNAVGSVPSFLESMGKILLGSPTSRGLQRVGVIQKLCRPLSTALKTETSDDVASIQTEPYEAHKLSILPDTDVFLTKKEGLHYFEKMLTLRHLKKSLLPSNSQQSGDKSEVPTASEGFEGITIGLQSAIRPIDVIVSARPTPWWMYFIGKNSYSHFEQILSSKDTSCLKSKNDEFEFYDFGDAATEGDWIATGTGIALRCKIKKASSVCFVFCGNEASRCRGYVDETFYLSKTWNLPVVYLFENDSSSGQTKDGSRTSSQYNRNSQVPGIRLCNDVLSVREATGYSIAHCLAERGPIIMEIFSQSQNNHGVKTIFRMDPVERLKKHLLAGKLASLQELGDIEITVANSIKRILQPNENLSGKFRESMKTTRNSLNRSIN